MGSFTPHKGTHCFISISERTTHPTHGHLPFTRTHIIPSPSHRGMTHPSHGHNQLMGFLTPHRGTQQSIFVSKRNNTPISWAHPNHGISHRPTHSICVLEDVSHSCNHQHYEVISSFLNPFLPLRDQISAIFSYVNISYAM
jgi:hypothetical protein